MAKSSIASPTDVVDFLTAQHEQIKSLFVKTLSASGESRENAFVDLRRLLAVHETVEEEIVHPRAKRKKQRRCCSSWRNSTSTARSSQTS